MRCELDASHYTNQQLCDFPTSTLPDANLPGATEANAPREKAQWMFCNQKTLALKYKFNLPIVVLM